MECYLDNSATTRCSDGAARIMNRVLQEDYGNPSSLHRKGMEAENYIRQARENIAKTLHCQPKEIVFTSGGTEGNNTALIGGALANQRAGRHLITSSIEHAAVANPMKFLEAEGFEVTYLGVDSLGHISLEELRDSLRPDTILVSIMQVNNEIGAIEPIAEAAKIVKDFNSSILFHVDAIQSYGKMEINVKKLNIDLLSVSGHKIHGPKGSGFLYIREKCKVKPLILGGGQENGFRSGTENVPAIAGLGYAAKDAYDHLKENRDNFYARRRQLIRGLLSIEGVSLNGALDESNAPHIVSCSVSGVRAEVLLHSLEDKGVYVSAGSACSSNRPSVSRTLTAIGLTNELLDSTVRFSLSPDTTVEEIDYALAAMQEIVPMLRRYSRK